ncbi:unnamed protein product, partial [Tetraodon nigroviridis]
AWFLDNNEDDQRKPHRQNPNCPVSMEQLKKLGVFHWKLNADVYETDPELEKIRKDHGYSYMDIITIHRDTLSNYEEKLKVFFDEHLHLDDEIRYILDGTAYFDVRDKEDRWIRIAMNKGDMITLPAGIYHRFTVDETLNADVYETDPELEKIRKDHGYSYMDIITIHRDTLSNYEEKLKVFFDEHLHLDDEIRYILDGTAYFDVRDKEDRWIRIAMNKGDMITLPAGIYHRFTVDETSNERRLLQNYTKAMRLFVGEPVWKAYNRPADHFEIRQKYAASLQ